MLGSQTLAVKGRDTAETLAGHAGRFTRFAAVGASGVLVNNAVLYLAVERLHLQPVLGAVLATETAILSNFTLNDRWTFRDIEGSRTWFGRLVHYNVVVLGGLVIAVLTLFVLTSWFHVHYLAANFVGIAAGTAWNYCMNVAITWRHKDAYVSS
jgi:dolichol-phosphate mannosyltransferase